MGMEGVCVVCGEKLGVGRKYCSVECMKKYQRLLSGFKRAQEIVNEFGMEIGEDAFVNIKKKIRNKVADRHLSVAIAIKYLDDCGVELTPHLIKRSARVSLKTANRLFKELIETPMLIREERFLETLNEEDKKLYEEIAKYTPKPSLRRAVFDWLKAGGRLTKTDVATKHAVSCVSINKVLKKMGLM